MNSKRSAALNVSYKALLLACLFCLQALDKTVTFTVAFVPLRLGLANLLLLAALSKRLPKLALFLMAVKVIFVFLGSGSIPGLLSLLGTSAAFVTMYFTFKLLDLFLKNRKLLIAPKENSSLQSAFFTFLDANKIVIVSIVAACSHMVAQLMTVAFLFKVYLFKLPLLFLLLLIIAALSGLAVGICWQILDEQSIVRQIWKELSHSNFRSHRVLDHSPKSVKTAGNSLSFSNVLQKKQYLSLSLFIFAIMSIVIAVLIYVKGYNYPDLRQALPTPFWKKSFTAYRQSDENKYSEIADVESGELSEIYDKSNMQTHLFGKYLDTAITYTGIDTANLSFSAQCRLIEESLQHYDSLFNAYSLPKDEMSVNLAVLNLRALENDVVVDGELYTVIAKAASYYDLTGGAFNPFIGTLSEIQKKLLKLQAVTTLDKSIDSMNMLTDIEPAKTEDIAGLYARYLAEAKRMRSLFSANAQKSSWADFIALDPDRHAIRFLQDIKLDLGAIAKDYIGNEIVSLLRKAGVERGLLNIGGSISTLSSEATGRKWKVAVERPRKPAWFNAEETEIINNNLQKYQIIKLSLSTATLSVSGTYERQAKFKVKGKTVYLNHLLDTSDFTSSKLHLQAAVLTSEPMLSDVLATACFSIKDRNKIAELIKLSAYKMQTKITLLLTENDGTCYRFTADKNDLQNVEAK